MNPKNIAIHDYTYDLPADKIALYPLAERDASKLLIYKHGVIQSDCYKNIANHLPAKSLLVFNNTKVINARVKFAKPSGGVIEIFCLEPLDSKEYYVAMRQAGACRWKCMVGGAGKWKEGILSKELGIGNKELGIQVRLVEKLSDAYVIEFLWEPANHTFAEIIDLAGDVPLPPYIKRSTENIDAVRYQTIYAHHEGSVAAPTAGLHFTENIFKQLEEKNIKKDFVTLHVSAGTFKPVKSEILNGHEMHAEWITVPISAIENLYQQIGETVVAVGTTSLRTIESLYWLGVKVYLDPDIKEPSVQQWDAYDENLLTPGLSAKEALSALLNWLKNNKLEQIFTQTQLLIAPGYSFRLVNALVTNFHQPQSTLLLLVAAAIGDDWKRIYDYALQNDFRFLSYGDGCLIFDLIPKLPTSRDKLSPKGEGS